jgi:hypothetical protein
VGIAKGEDSIPNWGKIPDCAPRRGNNSMQPQAGELNAAGIKLMRRSISKPACGDFPAFLFPLEKPSEPESI